MAGTPLVFIGNFMGKKRKGKNHGAAIKHQFKINSAYVLWGILFPLSIFWKVTILVTNI